MHTTEPEQQFDRIKSMEDLDEDAIRCDTQENFNKYCGCFLRDDIDSKTQFIFLILFIIFMFLLIKAIMNIYIIYRIRRKTPANNMLVVNWMILMFIFLRLVFFFDGPLRYLNEFGYPLYLYLVFEAASILTINSVLCVGGHVWLSTVFSVTFQNKYKALMRYVYNMLMLLNLVFLITICTYYLRYRIQDNLEREKARHGTTDAIATVCLITSTASNGVFFIMGCIMLRRYIQRRWKESYHSEGASLAKLAIFGAFLSIIRVVQDIFGLWDTWETSLKRYSLINGSWWYVIYSTVFITLVDIIPVIYFQNKYTPNISSRIVEGREKPSLEDLTAEILEDNIQSALIADGPSSETDQIITPTYPVG